MSENRCSQSLHKKYEDTCLEVIADVFGLITTGFGFFRAGSRRSLYIAAGIKWLSLSSPVLKQRPHLSIMKSPVDFLSVQGIPHTAYRPIISLFKHWRKAPAGACPISYPRTKSENTASLPRRTPRTVAWNYPAWLR